MPRLRPTRVATYLAWVLGYAVAIVLVLTGLLVAGLQTAWGRERVRRMLVGQANRYLAATMEVGRLEGSLFGGVRLVDVRLSQDGQAVIALDEVSVAYRLVELIGPDIVIREVSVVRPRILAERRADGRWNLASLIRPRAPRDPRTPGRAVRILRLAVLNGLVTLGEPLRIGAIHVPSRYERLDAALSLTYQPGRWHLNFERASWSGGDADLTVRALSGSIESGRGGLAFQALRVDTPYSLFTLDGRVDRRAAPTQLDLRARAERFSFQEWASLLPVLGRVAVEGAFETDLIGPLAALETTLSLHSDAGSARGSLVLDTTVPGWRGRGTIDVERINLARWLSRPNQASDITGRARFDLILAAGGFPRGDYEFAGAHAAYAGYAADSVSARGTITRSEVLIAEARALAYGAGVRLTSGSIGVDGPYPFTFIGSTDRLDLRRLPATIPVPHVESLLAFDYQLSGQFVSPFLKGTARFGPSEFLGASVGDGATGAVDTTVRPVRYAGAGDLAGIDLARFGEHLGAAWLQDPRWEGFLSGRFVVDGAGSDPATMRLRGSGRVDRADIFGGRLFGATVSVEIADGSLKGSFEGDLSGIDPAIFVTDPRLAASLTGTGRIAIDVRDLLLRSPTLEDYTIDVDLRLADSSAGTVRFDRAEVAARLSDRSLSIARFTGRGPMLDVEASGRVELDGQRDSRLAYTVRRADLALIEERWGSPLSGDISTVGELTGPTTLVRLTGTGNVSQLEASGVRTLTASASYDAAIPTRSPDDARVTAIGRASFVEAFGQQLPEISGTVSYDQARTSVDLQMVLSEGVTAAVAGAFTLHRSERAADVSSLLVTVGPSAWRLVEGPVARVTFDEEGVAVTPVAFADPVTLGQRVEFEGTWKPKGGGALRVRAAAVSLDRLLAPSEAPARVGGWIDVDATLRGGRERPLVEARFKVTDGRVDRVGFRELSGAIDYDEGVLSVDLRLDQAPGVTVTAVGTVPLALFNRALPERPLRVALRSPSIDLAIFEGLTDLVRSVSGEIRLDVEAIGTSHDPHFAGTFYLSNVGFRFRGSDSRYRNGNAVVTLAREQVTFEALRIEDANGRPLEVRGSLGTHEMRVGDLALEVTSRGFEVLRNEYGRIEVDTALRVGGQFQSPRFTGRLTVTGGQLDVDTILDRVMLRPYATEARSMPGAQGVAAALNPWERLGLDIELHVPGTLRMRGASVQVAAGTPLGLNNINLRAIGDLYLYKDPRQPLYVTGSLDSVSGSYSFQGRRFELDPASSIDFRGDLNPQLFVAVSRVISGVDTRVTIVGPLDQPELRLASTPPLEASDILSLIVFGTSTSQLNALQQQELAVRAGTLAAGFVVTPMVSALQRSLGLDTLEIEPGAGVRGGPRVTIGQEIAPGLIARFSRQFGPQEYDEATVEYYLSRILRIRATFSDAGALASRSPFRRVERAGVDLLFFFSF
jgi:autotransporter translocation and assembly factor TamB